MNRIADIPALCDKHGTSAHQALLHVCMRTGKQTLFIRCRQCLREAPIERGAFGDKIRILGWKRRKLKGV